MHARWSWRVATAAVVGSLLGAAIAVLIPGAAGAAELGLPIAPSWITTTGRIERVRALAKLGNTVYVGGEFTAIAPAPNTPTIAQPFLFAMDATTGVYKPEFAPVITSLPSEELDPNGVLALETDPATNTLFVGGRLTSVNNQPLTTFAVLDATTGALKPGVVQRDGKGGSKAVVNAIYRAGSQLYVGGEFDHLGTTPRSRVARLDLSLPGFPVDGWEAPVQGGMVHGFAVDPSAPQRVYVGGRFTSAGPAANTQGAFLAAFDTSATNTLLNWFPKPDGGDKGAWVLGLDAANGRVYAGIAGGGGQFNVYSGVPGGTKLLVKQTRANGNVQAVKVLDNRVFFGGHYDYLTEPAYPVGKLNAYRLDTLAPDPTFKIRVSGIWGLFTIMGTSADDLWVGGQLVSVNSTDTAGSINIGNIAHLKSGVVADTQPPSAPGRPVVTNGVFTSLRVRWTPSTDDRFVSAYQIYADGNLVAVASGQSTSATITGLAGSRAYQITVRALDGGRNLGPASPPTAATTGAAPPALPSPLKGYGEFYPVTPSRVLDTRTGIGGTAAPVAAGAPRTVQVTGGQVPGTGVSMVALNVTVTQPSAGGFLTAYPAGEAQPNTSNLNFTAGQTVPNFVLARVPAAGAITIAVSAGHADVLVDVVGWFGSATTPTPGAKITTQPPLRVLDTRQPGSAMVGPGKDVEVQVATPGSGINGVVLNVTATGPTATSFVTVYPADQASPPNASNLNVLAGETRPNMVMVKVPTSGPSAGRIKLYNAFGSTHLIVDVMATFKATAAFDNKPSGRLLPLTNPVRLIDTRQEGGPLGGGQVATWDLRAVDDATPATVVGLVANATATQASASTFLTLFPAGPAVPNASNLNVVPGEDVPNAVTVGLSASGALNVFNAAGRVQYILDLAALVLGP